MDRLVRFAVPIALLGVGAMGILALQELAFTDYDSEVRPAYVALLAGDFQGFLQLSPGYAGAVLLRAPLALLADALGGGEMAVYRAVALPGLAALSVLGVALAARARAAGASATAAWLVLALCVVNPLAFRALEIGHAEELLAAGLAVGAMLLAQRERAGWAGLLAGLAVATKPWALVAVPAVLVVLPAARLRAGAIALLVPALLLAPWLLATSPEAAGTVQATTGNIFKPWQVWWMLGSTDVPQLAPGGVVLDGYRSAPGWLSPVSHPLIVLVAVPLSVLWARRREPADGLLLLALLLLLRCLLDPWNNVYYALPCVLALGAHEAGRGRAPVGAAAVTAATWLTIVELPAVASPDAQALAYLAWALPAAAALALRVYSPATWARLRGALTGASVDARELLRVRAEDLRVAVGDDDQVLDPHPEAPR